jgi:osmotically-inducible protein OsmY
MNRRRIPSVATALALLLVGAVLSGCALAVGAGAGVGAVAVEERGIKGRANDLSIEAKITDKFLQEKFSMITNFSIDVYEGRVMLTGATTDTAAADRAVALAWQVDGVTDVYNEIQYNSGTSFSDYSHDVVITTSITTALTFDKEVLSVNYDIKTVNGTVYIMGIAQNQAELDKVIAQASNTQYVRKVVHHVRIKQPTTPAA